MNAPIHPPKSLQLCADLFRGPSYNMKVYNEREKKGKCIPIDSGSVLASTFGDSLDHTPEQNVLR